MPDIILLLLCSVVFIVPFCFAPLKFLDGYILPQIGAAGIGITIVLMFFIANGILIFDAISFLVFLYFIYLLLTCSWSTVIHNSVQEVPLIFACFFGYIISYSVFENLFYGKYAVALTVFVLSILLSLYGIGQKFGRDILFRERIVSRKDELQNKEKHKIPVFFQNKNFIDTRVIATIGNTNFAAGFYLATLPFFIYLAQENLWFLTGLIFPLTTIWFTKSRAAVLGLLIGLLVFVLMVSQIGLVFDFFFLFSDLRIEIVLILSTLILVGGWELILLSRKRKWFYSLQDDNDINNFLDIENTDRDHFVSHLRYRLRYIKAALYLIGKRPLTGYGLRSYRKEVYNAQAQLTIKDDGKFLGPNYQTPQPREVHNDFVENFVEGGLIGGGLFLVVLFLIFVKLFEIQNYGICEYLYFSGYFAFVVAIMVNAFFFFPLRLASSGLLFWISLALMNSSFENKNIVFDFSEFSFLLIIVFLPALLAMLWEGTIKPNLGNYYFTKYNFSKNSRNRERWLLKAVNICPRNSIFRTHLVIGYMDTYIDEASSQAEVLRQHYDGMVPAWVMSFNSAMIKIRQRNWAEAVRFLKDSLYFYPYFEPAIEQMSKIINMAPLERRRIVMKNITDEGRRALESLKHRSEFVKEKINSLTGELKNIESDSVSIILQEKVRLNIPLDWAYDLKSTAFLSPTEYSDKKVAPIGVAGLPIIVDEEK